MKITKLVVGILQIILGVYIAFMSMTLGMVHAVENSHDAGGTAGMITAILFLTTGIVYISTRKSPKLGGDIAGLVMMLLAWIIAISNAHDYGDLQIWGWLALIIGVGFFVWHLIANRKTRKMLKQTKNG
ncbi:MAG TPA: hypothetical protein DG851_01195 [Lactobacillus acetotolerans]|jgi:FtsH-binding integral membrane protein|nr:hypothetical protein [Lactobacillus acetotolerans]